MTGMQLKVLAPYQVFAATDGVQRIVLETASGCFGIWPHRLDCFAALVPGILTYETEAEGEAFIAVDEGAMVKSGSEVLVSVRRAVIGTDLRRLHELVAEEFMEIDERERSARAAMAKLEIGFLNRFVALHRER